MKRGKSDVGAQFRVLLVDQDAGFGRQLAQALHVSSGFRLCRQVQEGVAAQTAVAEEHPDVVVAAVEPDNTTGFHLLRSLIATAPEHKILATSRRCEPAHAEKVLLAGARGLLLKSEPAEEILNAVRTVSRDEIFVSRSLTMPLLKRLLNEPSESAHSGMESLTDRELQVFELLGMGLSTREVAARLGLSCKTVDSHRAKIQHRLGVDSAAALAQIAFARAQLGFRNGGRLSNGSDNGTPPHQPHP